MKTLNLCRRDALFLIIAALAFLSLPPVEVLAQSEIQFNALYNCPNSSLYNFKVLDCKSEKYCKVLFVNTSTPSASFEDEISKSKILDAFKAGGCTINGKRLEPVKNTAPQENPVKNSQSRTSKTNNGQKRRFKVGERVLASPMAMDGDEYFEKCTVIKDYMETEGYDTYRVKCDDPKGGIGQEANVKIPYIRVWANAEPPPAAPDCPFNEPPGTVTRTSKPSAELFQRVIYEWKRDTSNGRKVGITFQMFQMGKPYRNTVMSVPGRGAQLRHDGAPQGAMIYPVKSKYLFCDRHTDSTIRWVVDSQFACFKNRDGDWVCPVDSVPKYLEQIYLPNK